MESPDSLALVLVTRVARAWGVTSRRDGKTTWAEIDCPRAKTPRDIDEP